MIFVTLGTHEQPFGRLLDLVTPLAENDDILVQHGHTPPRLDLDGFRWIDFAAHDECAGYMRAASTVICHAGVGSIMTALTAHKLPVVVPRLKSLGEHVDDHQLQVAQEFHSLGLVIACLESEPLGPAAAAAGDASPSIRPDGRLLAAIAAAVVSPTPPRGPFLHRRAKRILHARPERS